MSGRKIRLALGSTVGLTAVVFPFTNVSAITSTWNVNNGGNWSTNWDIDYPKATGDTGTINNTGWTSGTNHPINIDVTDITGGELSITDVAGPGFVLNVNQNATFDKITFTLDGGGAGRGGLFLASGKTLTVNQFLTSGYTMNLTSGGGTLKFSPDGGGTAAWSFQPGEFVTGGTIDFTSVTTVNITNSLGGASNNTMEARNSTWLVGRTAGNQTWNLTNLVSPGTDLNLSQRSQSNPWDFVKVGANNVSMADFKINRNSLLNFGIALNHQGKLFTDAAGAQIGGTVTISDYYLPNLYSGTANRVQMDTLGANLTIATGGTIRIQDDENTAAAQTNDDDVNALRVLPGNTVLVQGTGGITVRDQFATTTGRLGIYFPGSTLDSDGNVTLQGPRTFLNDGGSASQLKVGGNLSVESRNASGFTTLSTSPTADATFDDFRLSSTTLTMDGGGTHTLNWDTGAANTGTGFTAADFTNLGGGTAPINFTLDTLIITNNTIVNYSPRELYLDGDTTGGLNIDLGSVLNFTGGHIYILDPNNSEFARLNSYPFGRILGAQVLLIPGVGELITVPEPGTAMVALLAGIGLIARRRRN